MSESKFRQTKSVHNGLAHCTLLPTTDLAIIDSGNGIMPASTKQLPESTNWIPLNTFLWNLIQNSDIYI